MKDGKVKYIVKTFGLKEEEALCLLIRFDPKSDHKLKGQTAIEKTIEAIGISGVDPLFSELITEGNEQVHAAIDFIFRECVDNIVFEGVESILMFLDEMNQKLRRPIGTIEDPEDEIKAYDIKMRCASKVLELVEKLQALLKQNGIEEIASKAIVKTTKKRILSAETMSRGMQ